MSKNVNRAYNAFTGLIYIRYPQRQNMEKQNNFKFVRGQENYKA